jgi:hypothetical protein
LFDDLLDLVAHGIDAAADRAEHATHHHDDAERARDVAPVEQGDERRQSVCKQDSAQQRNEEWLCQP